MNDSTLICSGVEEKYYSITSQHCASVIAGDQVVNPAVNVADELVPTGGDFVLDEQPQVLGRFYLQVRPLQVR